MPTHVSPGQLFNSYNDQSSLQWFSNQPTAGYTPGYVKQFNDFLKATDYSTTDFTLTLVGSGTSAVATTTNELNGALVLTTGASSSDSSSLQAKQEAWKLEAGVPLWFEARVAVSNVADVDLFVGLASTDTTPLDATDRAGFRMTNGAAVLNYETSVGGSGTSTASGTSLVAATYKRLGFWWNGSNAIRFYVDRQNVANQTLTIPTAQLAFTAHIKTNSANARNVLIDYFYAVKNRV